MLDKFDTVLANVSKNAEGSEWILVYDQLHLKDKDQVNNYPMLILPVHQHLNRMFCFPVNCNVALNVETLMEKLIEQLDTRSCMSQLPDFGNKTSGLIVRYCLGSPHPSPE